MNKMEPDEFHKPGEILNTHTLKHIIFHCQNYSNIKVNLEITDNFHEALGPDPDKINSDLKLVMYNVKHCSRSKNKAYIS